MLDCSRYESHTIKFTPLSVPLSGFYYIHGCHSHPCDFRSLDHFCPFPKDAQALWQSPLTHGPWPDAGDFTCSSEQPGAAQWVSTLFKTLSGVQGSSPLPYYLSCVRMYSYSMPGAVSYSVLMEKPGSEWAGPSHLETGLEPWLALSSMPVVLARGWGYGVVWCGGLLILVGFCKVPGLDLPPHLGLQDTVPLRSMETSLISAPCLVSGSALLVLWDFLPLRPAWLGSAASVVRTLPKLLIKLMVPRAP